MSARAVRAVALTLACAFAAGCAGSAEWRYYAPFRLHPQDQVLWNVDPAEIHFAGVASKLHYVSMSVDAVYYRDLPNTRGRQVAIGFELDGALPGRALKTISEPVTAKQPNGALFFGRPFEIEPFLYRGLPLKLTLTFRDVGPTESKNLLGRLQALALGVGRALSADAVDKLAVHQAQFEGFLGKAHSGKLHRYTFTLYPIDMDGVRQDLTLTAGQHVFIAIPAQGAPKEITQVRPADLLYKLRLRGRQLEWRDGREYTESPYVVLSIRRYRRYPRDDAPFRREAQKVDRLIEQGNLTLARSNLANVATALLEEKAITQMERNLELARQDVRAARIEAGLQVGDTQKAARLAALVRHVKRLGDIGRDFAQILEPAEVKELAFEARRLGRQARELGAELGVPAEPLAKETGDALAAIKPPVMPPASPVRLDKPPEVVTITVTKPTPFYKTWWFYALSGLAGAGFLSGTAWAVTRGGAPPAGPRIFVGQGAQGQSGFGVGGALQGATHGR